MHLVELFERCVGLGACELFREIAIERIFQNPFALCRGFDKACDQAVPRAFDVEHHRPELEPRIETGGGEPA